MSVCAAALTIISILSADLTSQHQMIVGLIAAHIGDEQHLQCFKNCLHSIEWQTQPMEYFGLSWSCESSFFIRCNNAIIALAKSLSVRSCIKFAYSPQKLSQFRHYERLTNWLKTEISSPSQAWIIFGDSDDIWGPKRVEMTHQKARANPSRMLIFPYYIASMGYNTPLSGMDAEITHLSMCGVTCKHASKALSIKSVETLPLLQEEGSQYEYWQYCCTVEQLVNFFTAAADFDRTVFFPQFQSSMLDFQWCDVGFAVYLHRLNNYTLVYHEPGFWYYLKWARFGETNLFDWETSSQGSGGRQYTSWRKKVTVANFPHAVDIDSVPCTTVRL